MIEVEWTHTHTLTSTKHELDLEQGKNRQLVTAPFGLCLFYFLFCCCFLLPLKISEPADVLPPDPSSEDIHLGFSELFSVFVELFNLYSATSPIQDLIFH